MEQNKSNFSIPAEQRQKWYSIAMVWIGAMICVSSLMVGGMLGNGIEVGHLRPDHCGGLRYRVYLYVLHGDAGL